MFLGFISSLQPYGWSQLTLAKDQNLFSIQIELGGEKKDKNLKLSLSHPSCFS